MSSLGERELVVNSRNIGRIRILTINTGQAVFPRLTFRIGVSLQDTPTDFFAPGRPIQAYEIRDIRGELRLEENIKALGLIHWAGSRRYVRSSANAYENQIEVVCDLDWIRVETLEDHRAGKEPVLWLVFWPTLVDAQGFLDCDIGPIKVVVPRDNWLQVLSVLTDSRREVLEVQRPVLESPEIDAAIGHIRESRARVGRGDFDEAVAACRRALESTAKALDVPSKAGAIEQALAAVTDDKRAKAYAGIVAKLKDLANYTIHRHEAPGRYTRTEALFVVGATEHTIALLTSLLLVRVRK